MSKKKVSSEKKEKAVQKKQNLAQADKRPLAAPQQANADVQLLQRTMGNASMGQMLTGSQTLRQNKQLPRRDGLESQLDHIMHRSVMAKQVQAKQVQESEGEEKSEGKTAVAVQRKVPSFAEFHSKTAPYKKHSQALKRVYELLNQYSIAAADPTRLNDRIKILNDTLRATQAYMSDHQNDADPNRRQVFKEMQELNTMIAYVDLPEQQQMQQAYQTAGMGSELAAGSYQRGKKLEKYLGKHSGDANSLFAKLAPMIDTVLPGSGDKGKLQVEFDIPVSSAATVGGRLTIEVERPEDTQIKLRGEMTVTGGVNVGIAQIKGELGGYVEAQAASSQQALNLISYSLYQRFRESKAMPHGAADFAWGGTSSRAGHTRAERWAGQVEQNVFGAANTGEDAYVEAGGLAGGKAKAGAGPASLEGQVKGTTGRRYDKTSVEAGKGALGTPQLPGQARQALGASTNAVEVSGSVTVGPLKGEVKYKRQTFMDRQTGQPTKFKELETSLEGTVPVSGLDSAGLAHYVAKMGADTKGFMDTNDSREASGGQRAGQAAALGESTFKPIIDPSYLQTGSFSLSPGKTLKLTLKLNSAGGGELIIEKKDSNLITTGASMIPGTKLEKYQRIFRRRRVNGSWQSSEWNLPNVL